MYMSNYLLSYLDIGTDDIYEHSSTLTNKPYPNSEKLSLKTFFLVVELFLLN